MSTLPYVWDYDIDKEAFLDILAGNKQISRLNREWAVLRLRRKAICDFHQSGRMSFITIGWRPKTV
jgi:hypothetical protein